MLTFEKMTLLSFQRFRRDPDKLFGLPGMNG